MRPQCPAFGADRFCAFHFARRCSGPFGYRSCLLPMCYLELAAVLTHTHVRQFTSSCRNTQFANAVAQFSRPIDPGRKLASMRVEAKLDDRARFAKSMLHQKSREARWTRAAVTTESHGQTLGKTSHVLPNAIARPNLLAQNTRLNDGRRLARNLRTFLIAFIGFSFSAWAIMAQGLNSSPDGFRNSTELHGSNEFNRSNDSHHINRYRSTGKPCIALESFATIQPINKNIYEHWITASNSCGQNIRIQVCYHKSDDCIVMNVPPYDNKNAVLGIQPSMKEFQYDVKEK